MFTLNFILFHVILANPYDHEYVYDALLLRVLENTLKEYWGCG